jgi:alanine racemase
MSRLAIAILSTENLLHNLEVIKHHSPGAQIIGMIKANGYGHGLRSVAMRLEKKIYSLGVASIDEALALRNVGVKIPITLMSGPFEPDDLLIASCQNFHCILHDQSQIEWLSSSQLPVKLNIWLKIDTGMGRLGFSPEHAKEVYNLLSNNSQINQPIGIMSHLACADDKENPLNLQQIKIFEDFVKTLPSLKSLYNSAGIFNFANSKTYDVVRPGLALYGISPLKDKTSKDLGLKPVMTLQTRLISVKFAPKNSYIGYGGRFKCDEDMKIGVIAMGYGDGYPRTARDGAPVLVNGIRCRIVGRISMDMITIDLTNCIDAKIGDHVILWGQELPLEEVATYTDNIPYDIICAVQQRVKFHWTIG